jgi:hypothetical protein
LINVDRLVLKSNLGSEVMKNEYGVLSPWAEADPIPLKGISPRVSGLAGKKIGLFYNIKRAAQPIAMEVEKNLKTRFPSAQISYYPSKLMDTLEVDGPQKANFEQWVKGVDAVVGAVGD